MSQIADFYVVPDSAIAEIRDAALPKKAGLFGKPKDTFWDTLWSQAGNGRLDYEWSGYCFVIFFEYLREKGGFDIESLEKSELAAFLSESRESYFLSFSPAQAQEFSTRLHALSIPEADITQFVIDFCGPEDHETMVSGIMAAAKALPTALEQGKPGTIGLMNVG